MKDNQTVQIMSPGQVLDLSSALTQAIPSDLPEDIAQAWIGSKGELRDNVARLLKIGPQYSSLRKQWGKIYKDVFDVKLDLSPSGLLIPTKQPGFDRLIVVAPGITEQGVYNECAKLFPCWGYYSDLNKAITHSDRNAIDRPYAVWFRNRQEADEELKNKSANALAEEGIPGITLLECLLFELVFFKETGQHLDVKNITLCAGSRDSDGDVPDVNWNRVRLYISWYAPGSYDGDLRARQAVS